MSSPNPVSDTHDLKNANLIPVVPADIRDSRYQGNVRVKLSSTIIPLGTTFGLVPSYQSQGWSMSVHPEGKRYAYSREQEGITVVTEANVLEPGMSDLVDHWLLTILAIANDNHVQLPATSDLFIEIDQKMSNCYYYFADHGHRKVFWLHDVDTVPINLPDACSMDHLQHSLQENYWIHVEMFPDTASQYCLTALNELESILLHARADSLTSDVPTFPYTGEQNKMFLDILQRSKEHAPSAYVTAFVARLWVVVAEPRMAQWLMCRGNTINNPPGMSLTTLSLSPIANHRFFTHFGEAHCRMSSNQSVVDLPERKRNFILSALSLALFGLPNQRRESLEGLWVDAITYTSAWRKHVSNTVDDLKQRIIWTFALMIVNLLMMPISSFLFLNKSSMLLCVLGLGIAFVILQEQQKLVDSDSATGAAYLDARNTSYGFQPTAIVHSLPHALFVWALLLFAIQGFWMAFADLPTGLVLPVVIPVGVVLSLTSVAVWIALHPREKNPSLQGTTVSIPIPSPSSTLGKDQPMVEAMV